MLFLHIFFNVILPIVLVIGAGIILQRSFKLDLNTYSKLMLYFFMPVLAFVKIYESKTTTGTLMTIFGFLALHFVVMTSTAYLLNRALRHNRKMSASFSNSVVLSNNGNIGIPLNDLAFNSNPLAMSVQMMIVLFEMMLVFTYGLITAGAANVGIKSALKSIVRMPILYCIFLAVICNALSLSLPAFILIPCNQIANGMIALALISIGAQIAHVKLYRNTLSVAVSSFTRLLLSPLLAFCLLSILGIGGITAQVLWLASAMPSSRNSASLALEYNNEPEFAAQTVLVSTLCSSVTLVGMVSLAPLLFG